MKAKITRAVAAIITAIRRNPVRARMIVLAGVAVLASFGLELTAEQVGTLTAFLALVFGEDIRRQVTPVPPDDPPDQ